MAGNSLLKSILSITSFQWDTQADVDTTTPAGYHRSAQKDLAGECLVRCYEHLVDRKTVNTCALTSLHKVADRSNAFIKKEFSRRSVRIGESVPLPALKPLTRRGSASPEHTVMACRP